MLPPKSEGLEEDRRMESRKSTERPAVQKKKKRFEKEENIRNSKFHKIERIFLIVAKNSFVAKEVDAGVLGTVREFELFLKD